MEKKKQKKKTNKKNSDSPWACNFHLILVTVGLLGGGGRFCFIFSKKKKPYRTFGFRGVVCIVFPDTQLSKLPVALGE